jgi:hypothetical protein
MPKYKEIFIYAGSNKTATCSVRHALSSNRDCLLSQRILYPSFPGRSLQADGSPCWDASPIIDDLRYKALHCEVPVVSCPGVLSLDNELRDNVDNAERVILMSERFFFLTVIKNFERFREWVEHLYSFADNIKIYCVLRRYPEYIESLFSHLLSDSWNFPNYDLKDCSCLQDWIRLFVKNENLWRFSDKLLGFERMVGADNVSISVFPDGLTDERILLDTLLKNIGVSVPLPVNCHLHRDYPTSFLFYCFEALKHLQHQHPNDYVNRYRAVLHGCVKNGGVSLPIEGKRYSMLYRDLASEILIQCVADDSQYMMRKCGMETPFSTDLSMYNDTAPSVVLDPLLVEKILSYV